MLKEVIFLDEEDIEESEGVLIELVGSIHDGEMHVMPPACPCCGSETYQFVTRCCARTYEVVVSERKGYYLEDPEPHEAA